MIDMSGTIISPDDQLSSSTPAEAAPQAAPASLTFAQQRPAATSYLLTADPPLCRRLWT